LTLLVVASGCLVLGWWQLTRALSGNTLSWAYVFEWPFFAAYAVYMWWKLVHEQPGEPPPASSELKPDASSPQPRPRDKDEEEEDEELAAYNRYLAELSAADDRKTS